MLPPWSSAVVPAVPGGYHGTAGFCCYYHNPEEVGTYGWSCSSVDACGVWLSCSFCDDTDCVQYRMQAAQPLCRKALLSACICISVPVYVMVIMLTPLLLS